MMRAESASTSESALRDDASMVSAYARSVPRENLSIESPLEEEDEEDDTPSLEERSHKSMSTGSSHSGGVFMGEDEAEEQVRL